MTESTQPDVKQAAREAVNSGSDIDQQIRAITIKALTKRELDTENIRTVVNEVATGISEALTTQGEQTKTAVNQAVSALDEALAVAAEASKLAMEEASSKVSEYSEKDFTQAKDDLLAMEGLFLETLEKVARDGNETVAAVFSDMADHARKSGTAVGKRVLAAVESLQQLPQLGLSNTVSAASTLAHIGSTILEGIAESLNTSQRKQ